MADLILEIVEGKDAGRQLQLDRVLDIGRDQGLPIALPDDTQASRRHARVSPQNGAVVVEDLGSTNGTFVNDQPIHSPRSLSPGDRIRVGLTVIEVRSPQQVQARPSAVQPRPQLTAVGEGVLAPVAEAPAPGGFVPAAGAAQGAPPPAPQAPAANLPSHPGPPLPGRDRAAPQFQPGVGFRAQDQLPGYVPQEVIDDEEARSDYGALANMVDVSVKSQRNIAAFAMLAASGLAVLLYFGLQ
jgi:hypothetical protein